MCASLLERRTRGELRHDSEKRLFVGLPSAMRSMGGTRLLGKYLPHFLNEHGRLRTSRTAGKEFNGHVDLGNEM